MLRWDVLVGWGSSPSFMFSFITSKHHSPRRPPLSASFLPNPHSSPSSPRSGPEPLSMQQASPQLGGVR